MTSYVAASNVGVEVNSKISASWHLPFKSKKYWLKLLSLLPFCFPFGGASIITQLKMFSGDFFVGYLIFMPCKVKLPNSIECFQ